MRIEVVCLDMHVTEIESTIVQLPHLFTDEFLDPLPGVHLLKVHLPVEDVVAGADVNESVLHGELVVGLWGPESVLRLKLNYENIHKNF